MKKLGPWTRKGSRIVHENPFFRVREDDVIMPSGVNGTYWVVEKSVCVSVVAVDRQGCVVLIELYRYTSEQNSIEIISGGLEEADADPLSAAKRELQEEAGFQAAHWHQLPSTYESNGLINREVCNFVAESLTELGVNQQAEEGIQRVVRLPFSVVMGMVDTGKIVDGVSITAIVLAERFLAKR